jgi:hypothetical protein
MLLCYNKNFKNQEESANPKMLYLPYLKCPICYIFRVEESQFVIFEYRICYDRRFSKYPFCYIKCPNCYDNGLKEQCSKQVLQPKQLNSILNYYKHYQIDRVIGIKFCFFEKGHSAFRTT